MTLFTLRESLRLILTTDYSYRAIGRYAGLSHNTIGKYARTVKRKKLSWDDIQSLSDRQLIKLFRSGKPFLVTKRIPDWARVYEQMQQKHQTLLQLWEEYREINASDAFGYSQFTHYYRKYIAKLDLTMRQAHHAGECVFVDYAGTLIPWTDSATGQVHHAQVFVGVMGCSNYTFAYASPSQKIEDWIDAHNEMLAFFEGVPQVVVPDNLKSAVIKAGGLPEINRTYLEWSRHYNCVISPARVRKPQDKSKAELGVLFVSRWISAPLRRRQFFSVAEINDAIAELLPRFNERTFKRLPGCRRSRFEALDKPALKALPANPFEHADWIAEQKVGPDYHVYIKGHAYSVPFRLVADKVEARITTKVVEILYQSQRVAVHARSYEQGGSTTDPNHRPAKHQAYAEQTKESFIRWANSVGPNALQAVTAQFKDKPEYSLFAKKACIQLKKLASMHGESRFEAACLRARSIHSMTVKSIRSILQRRLDEVEDGEISAPLLPRHHNVRGSHYYDSVGGK